MSGCDASMSEFTSWLNNPEGNTAANITEPQGNSQDFLIQDYNVKDVEQDTIDKLDEFDTSGPAYSGVSEIIADADAATSGSTLGNSIVVVSTMHTQSPTGGTSKLQNWICKSPGVRGDVWAKIGALSMNTQVYNYSSEEEANDLLRIAYTKCNGTRKSSDPVTDDMVQEFKNVVGSNASSGLRGAKKVVSGYSYKASAFSIENAIASRLTNVLENDGYDTVYTKNSSSSGLDFVDRSMAGQENYAKCHIVIWSRAASNDEGSGWMIFYNDATDYSTASKALSGYLTTALENCSVSKGIDSGYIGTSEHFGDSDHYAILNWSKVPTIILVVGDYSDADTKKALDTTSVQEEFVEAIVTAVKKL